MPTFWWAKLNSKFGPAKSDRCQVPVWALYKNVLITQEMSGPGGDIIRWHPKSKYI